VLTPHQDGVVIEVWVVPGASRTEVAGVHDGALRLRVAAPAEGGKANKAIAKLLQSLFEAPTELMSGTTSRRKRFLVRGVSLAQAEKTLS